MRYARPLVPGRLLRRWMRFLSEVELEDGRVVRAHCPNPGAMTGLKDPGARVWLEPNDDPRKKLDWGWRLVELPGAWVSVDTSEPNRLVAEALAERAIPGLPPFDSLRAEVAYGRERSRCDFRLDGPEGPVWLEVKGVSLSRSPGLAEFPDTVTDRGARHLREMAALAREGERCVTLYVVQRTDCDRLAIAGDIDPAYAAAFDDARAAGVRMLAMAADIGPEGARLGRPVSLELPGQSA